MKLATYYAYILFLKQLCSEISTYLTRLSLSWLGVTPIHQWNYKIWLSIVLTIRFVGSIVLLHSIVNLMIACSSNSPINFAIADRWCTCCWTGTRRCAGTAPTSSRWAGVGLRSERASDDVVVGSRAVPPDFALPLKQYPPILEENLRNST